MQVHCHSSIISHLSSVLGTPPGTVDRARELTLDWKGLMDFCGIIWGWKVRVRQGEATCFWNHSHCENSGKTKRNLKTKKREQIQRRNLLRGILIIDPWYEHFLYLKKKWNELLPRNPEGHEYQLQRHAGKREWQPEEEAQVRAGEESDFAQLSWLGLCQMALSRGFSFVVISGSN